MLHTLIRKILLVIAVLIAASCVAIGWIWLTVEWHKQTGDVPIHCSEETAIFDPSQPIKIVSYNVQYMASKNYFFFYDGDKGEDSKPANKHISWTIREVAKLIARENPDIVLLQEVNDAGDARTHHRDLLDELQIALGNDAFPCHASADYWRVPFVPHLKILGGVSMNLTTLSMFEINTAYRHPLPIKENNWLFQRFYFQRAILETQLINTRGEQISILNTHFDAWTGGSDLSNKQATVAFNRVMSLEQQGIPWILGGDFNVLPPDDGRQWKRLMQKNITGYDRKSAVMLFYEHFGAIPPVTELKGEKAANWYTYFSNRPDIKAPDRTIDYVFYSPLWTLKESRVVHGDTLSISDHLPVAASFSLERTH